MFYILRICVHVTVFKSDVYCIYKLITVLSLYADVRSEM